MGLFDSIKKFVDNIFGAIGDVLGYVLGIDTDLEDKYKGQLINKSSNIQKIPVIYGERLVGGTRVFVSTGGGKKNQYLYIALVLSEGEVDSIGDIYINDIISTDSRFTNKATIYKYRGTDNQAATTLFADADESWTSAHQLKGVAYLAMRFKYDQDVFTSIPEIRAVVKGKKVYNPATQITEWSDNPALCLRDYLTNPRYGKGLPASAIDDASIIQAASDCDSLVTPYGGATDIPLFKFNAIIDTGETVFDNVKKIIASMRGILPYSNGKYSLLVDKDQSSTFTLTEDNILSDIKIVSSSKENKFNQVTAKFPNPAKRWELDTVTYPDSGSTEETAFLNEDNQQILSKEITLHNVTNAYRAKDLARIACLASRRQSLTVSVTCTSEALNIAVGDIVTIEHDSLGWTGTAVQEFRVMGMVLDDSGEVDLTLQQYDASIYPWVEQSEIPDNPETTLPDPFTTAPVTNQSGTGQAVVQNDGTVTYFYDLEWDEPDDALVEYYLIDVNKTIDEVETLAAETLQTQNLNFRYMVSDTSIDYGFTIRAVNGAGTRSAGVTIPASSVIKDTTPPSVIDAQTTSVVAGLQSITVSWENPTEEDFDLVRIKVNDTNTEPTSHFAATRSDTFIHDIGEYSTIKYYWIAPVDTSGNVADYTFAGSATTGSIDYGDVLNPPTIPEVATTVYLTLGDNNAPTDTEFNTAVGRDPIENDFVVVNKEFAFVYNGTSWDAVTEFIDGSLLVSGSISASDITTGTLNANDVTVTNLSGESIKSSTAVTVGTGDDVSILSGADTTYRLWAGDATASDAPFSVTKEGVLNATGANISGAINAGTINAENISFTGSLIADGLSALPNVQAGNMTQSLRNEIENIIVTKFGSDASTGSFDEVTGTFDTNSDNSEICKITDFAHNGSDIDIDVTFSKLWESSASGTPSVVVNIQRSATGANSWTTIKTQTITGSSYYEPEVKKYLASISGNVTHTDNPATGNYDYRFFAGQILNLATTTITVQLEANEQGEQIGTIDLANYSALAQDETITGNWTFSGSTSGISYGDLSDKPTIPDVSGKADLSGDTFTGVVKSSKNIATTTENGTFDVSKTLLGNIHFANGEGFSGSPKQAGITWQGNYSTQSQASIYVVNDSSSGTHMSFTTTNSYSTGPQIGLNITNYGVVDFPRARPTYNGNGLWASSDFTSTDISNWDTAYGWGNHADAGYLTVESYENLQQLTFNVNQADSTTSSNYNIQGVKYSNGRILAVQNITGYTGNSTEFRWRFRDLGEASPSSQTLMSLTPTSYNTADLEVSGSITATGYNDSNWNTAYGWGDHASAGYLTSHQDISGKANLSGASFTGVVSTELGENDGFRIGSSKLREIGASLIFNSDGIRFGTNNANWDYDEWAGLKYDHDNKVIYFGGARAGTDYWENNLGTLADTNIDFIGATNLKHNGTTFLDSSRNIYGETITGHKVKTDRYTIPSPRYDCSFYVLQSAHWYAHTNESVMYIGESSNKVRNRGTLRVGADGDATGSYKLQVDGGNQPMFVTSSTGGCWIDLQSDTSDKASIGVNNGTLMDWYNRTTSSYIMTLGEAGNLNLRAGGYQVAGTTVIDSSRNIGNIGEISASGALLIGSGTSNSQSGVARLGGVNYQGEVNALSLVNSTTASLGNAVSINFHNASIYSPTGKIVTVQRGATVTDSSLEFYGYNGGLIKQVEIDYLGNFDLLRGGYEINGQTVIDSSRNLTNIGAITASGAVKGSVLESSYWVTKQLTGTGIGNSYDERVILLCPKIETNTAHTNIVDGKITALKTGGNVCDTFDVFCHSVWNDTRATFTSRGQRDGHKLVVFNYDGIKWIGIKFSYTANPYNYFLFQGQAYTNVSGNNNHQLKVVSYYDTRSGGTVLNSEIYNSLIDYNGNGINHKTVASTHYFSDMVGTSNYATMNSGGIDIQSGGLEIGGTAVIDSSRNLTNIGGTYKGNFGTASFSWAGSSNYPTLYSSHPDRWIMICSPHIPYLKNGVNGYTGTTSGSAITSMANSGHYWRYGVNASVAAEGYSIALNSTDWCFYIHNTDKMVDARYGYRVNNTPVIDSSRNLVSINAITATGSGMGLFSTNMSSQDDWVNSPISIRERGMVSSAQSADSYAPNLNFHWAGRTSNSLWMNSSGHLVYGSYSATGTPNADGTFASGAVRTNIIYDLGDVSTYLEMRGDGGGLRSQTSNGYIDFGAMNSSWAHIQTDRSGFYFNTGVTVDSGIVQSYNEDLVLRRARSSSHQMTLNTSGATFTGNVTAYSDVTLKDNITNIDNALDKVNSIRGVTYDRIDQDNARHAGVIAQEVEAVLPEVVHTDDNGIKSVAYGNMVGLLIEAIKEQQVQIDELKSKLEK